MSAGSPLVIVVNSSSSGVSSKGAPRDREAVTVVTTSTPPASPNTDTPATKGSSKSPARSEDAIPGPSNSSPVSLPDNSSSRQDQFNSSGSGGDLSPGDRMNGARPAYQQHQRHISSMSQPTPTPSRRGPLQPDTISLCSTTSAMSSCPDRHGFYGGAQFSEKPEKERLTKAQVLAREKKWLHMIGHWKEYMTKNYKKVRERCRKGIPSSVRPKAWFYLTGAYLLQEKYPTVYEEMLKREGDPHIMEEIRKDQHRQFPFHEMFLDEEKPGQKELFNVLKAYSILNPKVGYCQAQAPIAAFLLMHLPAEQAFWCFVSVCDRYLQDYFKPGMEVLQRDAGMLNALLKKTSPAVYRHLQKHKVEPLLFMTDWFLCAMTRTLPWDTLLRAWDMFLCEGIKILFKIALVILGATLGQSKVRKECNGLCETLQELKSPPAKYLEEDFLMHNALKLNVSRDDFEREHERQAAVLRRGKSANTIGG